jgi:flagellar motor switch protein FliN/FliY
VTTVFTGITELAVRAAEAAARVLPCDEVLTAGTPGSEPDALHGGAAVLAAFTGASSGELVLIVEQDLAAALQKSGAASLQLAAALQATVQATADAIGPVALAPVQQMDARLAMNRATAHAESTIVPLRGASGVRAVVARGFDAAFDPTPAPEPVATASRLDLLRSVEMEATAELGRTRMTVDELLSLRNGAVVELDRPAGAAADLYVNGRLIAHGEVVVIDENYGLRITSVVNDDRSR